MPVDRKGKQRSKSKAEIDLITKSNKVYTANVKSGTIRLGLVINRSGRVRGIDKIVKLFRIN